MPSSRPPLLWTTGARDRPRQVASA
jgi:hypothetical protein